MLNGLQLKVSNAEVLSEAKTAVLKRNEILNKHMAKNGDQITGRFICQWQETLLKIRDFIIDGKFNTHESIKEGVHGSFIYRYFRGVSDYVKIRDIEPIKDIALKFFENYKVTEGYFPETTYSFESYEKYNEVIVDFMKFCFDKKLIEESGNNDVKEIEK